MWQWWAVRIFLGAAVVGMSWYAETYSEAEIEAQAYCEARPQDCGIYND